MKEIQRRYLYRWLRAVLAVEFLILITGSFAWIIFVSAGAGFFAAFILRIGRKYPGNPEPLLLDFSSGILAMAAAAFCRPFPPEIAATMVKLALPFLLIAPHFAYILGSKKLDPPKPFFKRLTCP